jgi:glucuronate isomerase
MDAITLARDIEQSLKEVPLLDVHTHVDAEHLTARGLHDLFLYHMVVSDLASAGCPDRSRLPEEPGDAEAASRIERALPFLPAIRNTSCSWGLRMLLEELYGWKKPITAESWRTLDGIIRERSRDPRWPAAVLDRAGIRRSCTELWRRKDGRADELFQYSLEWAFFARCQWGEFDTALYELEKAWSDGKPGAPLPIAPGAGRPATARTVRTVKDVHDALDAYVKAIPDGVLSTAQHISTDISFRDVDERTMAGALKRRARAGAEERDIYASYVTEGFLQRLEARRSSVVFQFSLGAEPLPYETGSRLSQSTMAELAALVSRHQKISFQCFLSSAHANQTLCTLARELPNFSLCGYWWHNFFPPFIERVLRERLDMLSTARQVGFFSDAYTLEWSWAKAAMVRRIMAKVLADKVAIGQYSKADALDISREILYETPQALLGMKPRVEKTAKRPAGGAPRAPRPAAKTPAGSVRNTPRGAGKGGKRS